MLFVCDVNPTQHIKRAYVTHAFAFACIATTLVVWFDAGPAYQAVVLVRGDWWSGQLLSHALMHASLLHLIGNLMAIWVFGDNVEDALGHLRYGLMLVVAVVASALSEFGLDSKTEALIGASGGASGIMAGYLILHPRAHVVVLLKPFLPVITIVPARAVVALWLAANLLSALARPESSNVAWWGHLGGFAAGLVLVSLLKRADVPLLQPPQADAFEQLPRLARWVVRLSLLPHRLLTGPTPDNSAQAALRTISRRHFVINVALFLFAIILAEWLSRAVFDESLW